MLRKWEVVDNGRKPETKTGMTAAIASTLEAISDSSSVPPHKRVESSKPFIKALERIFAEATSKKRLP